MEFDGDKTQQVYPLVFEPVLKDYLWGGTKLEEFYGELPLDRVAESWQASCHPKGISIISNGPLKGRKLTEVIEERGSLVVGTEFEGKRYPLLVKVIDADEKLSVQVHPDDRYALFNDGEPGKNEMWYIISAEPGAYIYYGLIEGVTREQFKLSIRNNTVEDYLYKMPVSAGDAIYIPAGTVHAICEGIMLLEVQQNSDTTYRVYDYGRKDENGNPARPLHIEKALEVIDFSGKRRRKQKGISIQVGSDCKKTILAANRFFAAEVWDVSGSVYALTDRRKFFIYTIIDGSAEFTYRDGKIRVETLKSVLLPPAVEEYEMHGDFKAVKAYVPDLERDVYAPLASLGFPHQLIQDYIG